MAKVVDVKLGFWEKTYVPEVVRGLGVTLKHFFYNFPRQLAGKKSQIVTIDYPEHPRPYAPRFRGQHRLTLRENGQVRCVACMCCSTACPSNCIRIVASDVEDAKVEKAPVVFEIDQLRCVFCGMCVEACPCDAIRMDTGVHVRPTYSRQEAVHDIDLLKSIKAFDGQQKSEAIQGGANGGGVTHEMLHTVEHDLNPLDPRFEQRPADAPKKHDHGHDHHHGHH
jgi:NADH-quinone oxidoreductase subunit I